MRHSPTHLRRNAHYEPQLHPISVAEEGTHISHQSRECVLTRGGYRLRLADSPGQRSKASMLIKSMYSWRGYPTDEVIIPIQDPNRITLEASTGQELFGTITVGLDSKDGLLADELYENEINVLRRLGRSVCEMTKLAFDPKYSSKEVIASLFHLAYIYAHNFYDATDLLIEVNPRHASFYSRRLGFSQIGELRTCPRVDAPAVLLHISLDYMAAQISTHAGAREKCERSLYPYFFSEAEVAGLTTRIRNTT
jgi:hypothetical protein